MRIVIECYGDLFLRVSQLKRLVMMNWFRLTGIWIHGLSNVWTGELQLRSFCLICVIKFVQVIYCNLPTNNIRATQSVSFLGNSGLSHKFDFLISGFKDIPTRLIKTLSVSRNDSVFAKSILTDITQTRLIRDDLTKYYVFINDCSKENRRVKVNPDIITLFNQNDIIPVKYSKRNKFIKELAMWSQHWYSKKRLNSN